MRRQNSTLNFEPASYMNLNYLDFEQPIAVLEGKIEELQLVGNANDLNIADEIAKLREKSTKLTESIYSNLTAWDVVKVARHPQRPYTSDYIKRVFTDWRSEEHTSELQSRPHL